MATSMGTEMAMAIGTAMAVKLPENRQSEISLGKGVNGGRI
jgi:hypothetical protein